MKKFIINIIFYLCLCNLSQSKTGIGQNLCTGILLYTDEIQNFVFFYPGDYKNLDDFLARPSIGFPISNWHITHAVFDSLCHTDSIKHVSYEINKVDTSDCLLYFLPVKITCNFLKLNKDNVDKIGYDCIIKNRGLTIFTYQNLYFRYEGIECRDEYEQSKLRNFFRRRGIEVNQKTWIRSYR